MSDDDVLDLAAIKARAEAALAGPWKAEPVVPTCWCTGWCTEPKHRDGALYGIHVTAPARPGWRLQAATLHDDDRATADSSFIAHARDDVPALVAEVERLRAALGGVIVTAVPGTPVPPAGVAAQGTPDETLVEAIAVDESNSWVCRECTLTLETDG